MASVLSYKLANLTMFFWKMGLHAVTSSSVWINLPVSIIVLAALRRVSFEIDIRWKPHTRDIPSRNLPHLHRRQLTNYDPLLSGPSQMAPNRLVFPECCGLQSEDALLLSMRISKPTPEILHSDL